MTWNLHGNGSREMQYYAGGQAKLHEVQALAKIVESGSIPAIHCVERLRRMGLVQWRS
ncbi:hypothetical protein I6F26_34230 [Ensifer sp. IC3342]|nr:hypothetical protein [Ensifer sp. BRP08]MCA1451454.1 hypothetical protein [Ensifer sp. IC3342]